MRAEQFNVRMDAGLLKRVRLDSVKLDIALGTWAQEVIRAFLDKPIDERRKFFADRKTPARVFGPKPSLDREENHP